MDDSIESLIFQAIDETISEVDFQRLQDAIESDTEVREAYLRAIGMTESLRDVAADSFGEIAEGATPAEIEVAKPTRDHQASSEPDAATVQPLGHRGTDRQGWTALNSGKLALAATVLFCVSALAWWMGRSAGSRDVTQVAIVNETSQDPESELAIAGYATLRRAVGIRWAEGSPTYREGDVLPPGILQFDEGIAEIDFFCGATMIMEGPARVDLESDWSVRLLQGRMRASVPPAARGFIVKAFDSEIVDLGTEFAVEVGPESARLEVIDGEVELRGGSLDGSHLLTGDSEYLRGIEGDEMPLSELSTSGDVRRRSETAQLQRVESWRVASDQRGKDDRLISYYPIEEGAGQRVIRDASGTDGRRDGAFVGHVNRVHGRFGEHSTALEFGRPGARVRVRIDGDFQAYSFACWVRIDSLDRVYNSLFMGDGYENGEPHWQIRDDGRLMFSVMVDDTQPETRFDKRSQSVVQTAGRHHVYMSEPVWDVSLSGKWLHLAAVYDPAGRRVTQFVNGEVVSEERIEDRFYISELKIGAAELGNWGQPFRKTPWFAVRHLNGAIDEMAIFDAALSNEEIGELYEQEKPLGY